MVEQIPDQERLRVEVRDVTRSAIKRTGVWGARLQRVGRGTSNKLLSLALKRQGRGYYWDGIC
jgi:hypothetical protein